MVPHVHAWNNTAEAGGYIGADEMRGIPDNTYTVKDIIKILRTHRKIRCAGCNRRLSKTGWKLMSYDHSNGIKLKDLNGKKWVFAQCTFCGYQNALWKLFSQIEGGEKADGESQKDGAG
jgi:hypothetical protein